MPKKILFGLGNPGKKYEDTRHNLGHAAVMVWQKRVSEQETKQVHIVIPENQMNNSGLSLTAALANITNETKDILIIHDDLELPVGQLEITVSSSAKGHNGVRSIFQSLGSQDVTRLRLGIGRPPEGIDPSVFVLGKFTAAEKPIIQKMVDQAIPIISDFIDQE